MTDTSKESQQDTKKTDTDLSEHMYNAIAKIAPIDEKRSGFLSNAWWNSVPCENDVRRETYCGMNEVGPASRIVPCTHGRSFKFWSMVHACRKSGGRQFYDWWSWSPEERQRSHCSSLEASYWSLGCQTDKCILHLPHSKIKQCKYC